MNRDEDHNRNRHSDDDLKRIESVCSSFAEELLSKQASLESQMGLVPNHLRDLAFKKLLALEIDFLQSSESLPTLDSYIQKFPNRASSIAEIYRQKTAERITDNDSSKPTGRPIVDPTKTEGASLDSMDADAPTEEFLVEPKSSIVESDSFTIEDSPKTGQTNGDAQEKSGDNSNSKDSKRRNRTASFDDEMTVRNEFSLENTDKSFAPVYDEGRRYSIESEIDRGGMGVILKVKDLNLKRTLAMKVIRNQNKGKPSVVNEQLDRFVREASITSRLDHPGVVPVHEMAKDESGRLFFTMKYVQGQTLGKVFRAMEKGDPVWTRAKVLEVLVRVCDTLAFAHSHKVIHRDLKPANVMVGEFGETYVMDWGLAKVIGGSESQNQSEAHVKTDLDWTGEEPGGSATIDGSIIGTPHYMPPEQATGKLLKLDERTDIYSIGAMLYEILTGKKPYYKSRFAPDVIQDVCVGPPIPIASFSRNAPAELVAIAEKAMQRNRDDRYASASDMAEDIRAYLNNRVVAAYRTGIRAEVEKWFSRNRTLVVTAVMLLLTGLSIISFQQYDKSFALGEQNEVLVDLNANLETQKKILASSLQKQKVQTEKAETASLAAREATDLLLGRKLVQDSKRVLEDSGNATLSTLLVSEAIKKFNYIGEETNSVLFSAAAKLNEERVLNGHLAEVRQSIFSPDQTQILSISKDGKAICWEIATGKKCFTLFNQNGRGFTNASYSTKGHLIATTGNDGTVSLWNSKNGIRLFATNIGNSALASGSRPDAQLVLFFNNDSNFAVASANGSVHLFDVSQQKEIGILKTENSAIRFNRMVISRNESRLAISGVDGEFNLWNLPEQKLVRSIDAHPFEKEDNDQLTLNLDFNFDGSLLVSFLVRNKNDAVGPAKVWDSMTGETHSTIELGTGIASVDFHPKFNRLALGVQEVNQAKIQIWSLDTSDLWASSPALRTVPRFIKFAKQSDRIATISGENELSVWDIEDHAKQGKSIRHLDDLVGHAKSHRIKRAEFNVAGTVVASASADHSVRIWSLGTNRAVPILGRTQWPPAVGAGYFTRIDNSQNRIFVANSDLLSGRLYSFPDLRLIRELKFEYGLRRLNFIPESPHFLAWKNDGVCRCYDSRTGELIHEVNVDDTIYFAGFNSKTKVFAVSCKAKFAAWKMPQKKLIMEVKKIPGDSYALASDASTLIVYSKTHSSVVRYDPATGEKTDTGIVSCRGGRLSNDSKHYWCYGELVPNQKDIPLPSQTMHIIDAQSGKEKFSMTDDIGLIRLVSSVDFSEDGKRLLLSHYNYPSESEADRTHSVWSIEEGTKYCQFGYRFNLMGAARDYSRMLFKTDQGMKLVDGDTGRFIRTLQPTFGSYFFGSFSPNGKYFAIQEVSRRKNPKTRLPESKMSVWNATTGVRIVTLPDDRSLFTAGFLSDNQSFISVSEENKVQVWTLDLFARTRQFVSKGLTPTEKSAFLLEVDSSVVPSESGPSLDSIKEQITQVVPVLDYRRAEAWNVVADLRQWLGENPSPTDIRTAIEISKPLLSGPFESDPKILRAISQFYELNHAIEAAIEKTEQSLRHPRSAQNATEWSKINSRLESLRTSIAPKLATYQSAADLVDQASADSGNRIELAKSWTEDNDSSLIHFLNASLLYQEEKFESASEIARRITSQNPDDPLPYLLHARCLVELDKNEDAASLLINALRNPMNRSPELWMLWLKIGFSKLNLKAKELKALLPKLASENATETPYEDHVQWLLTTLENKQPVRINSGCYTDVLIEGENWSRDRFYSHGFGFYEQEGTAVSSGDKIEKTTNPTLFQTERYFPKLFDGHSGGYRIPLPIGKYKVQLGFAEIYPEDRSFDIFVNRVLIRKNYDPGNGEFATADVMNIPVEIKDGLLKIDLKSNLDLDEGAPATISFIEIKAD